jgi:hypothetical protein
VVSAIAIASRELSRAYVGGCSLASAQPPENTFQPGAIPELGLAALSGRRLRTATLTGPRWADRSGTLKAESSPPEWTRWASGSELGLGRLLGG